LRKPAANHRLKSRIDTGLLALRVGFVGSGCRGKGLRGRDVPPFRIPVQFIVTSVITVIPGRKSLT
jgi:hypothetical protein